MTNRTDTDYNEFPRLSEIKRDYAEFMSIINNASTLDELKAISEKYHLTISINGEFLEEYMNDKHDPITDICYEAYGCLAYIHTPIDNAPYFDVWCNATERCFIENITIDELTDFEYYKDVLFAYDVVKHNHSLEYIITHPYVSFRENVNVDVDYIKDILKTQDMSKYKEIKHTINFPDGKQAVLSITKNDNDIIMELCLVRNDFILSTYMSKTYHNTLYVIHSGIKYVVNLTNKECC